MTAATVAAATSQGSRRRIFPSLRISQGFPFGAALRQPRPRPLMGLAAMRPPLVLAAAFWGCVEFHAFPNGRAAARCPSLSAALSLSDRFQISPVNGVSWLAPPCSCSQLAQSMDRAMSSR